MKNIFALRMRGGRQKGAAAVEFALAMVVFLTLVIAIMEFARVMYVYATAIEATRLGARIAVVCDPGDTEVKIRMRQMLNILGPDNILITYPTSGCSAAVCEPVTVRLTGVSVVTSIPFIPLRFPVPEFSTSLPAESRSSAGNSLCGT